MPLDEYQCTDCGVKDSRIAGWDDHTALCVRCGGVMLRRPEAVLEHYFNDNGHLCSHNPFLGTSCQDNGSRQQRRTP